MSTPDSFANLLGKSANETPDVPLPPAGAAIIKAFDLTLTPPREDGKSYRTSLRVGYVAPADPNAEPVNAADFETIFHSVFLSGARDFAQLASIGRAFGAGDIPMIQSDGNGGLALNPEFVEALKGREARVMVKLGTRKDTGTPEVRLSGFAPLG